MRVPPLSRLLALLALLVAAAPAVAGEIGTYRFDPGGRVRDVRVLDMNGDGRPDLVVLLEDSKRGAESVLVLRTPKTPTPGSYYPADHVTRFACDGELADAGALAVGRFGPRGEARVRFFGPRGLFDVTADGKIEAQSKRHQTPCLFARSTGQRLIFWDAVRDLDGDGLDETWFPLARGDGAMFLRAGRAAGDRTLSLAATNLGASSSENLLERHAYVPNLVPADLNVDGKLDLIALRDQDLLGWVVSDPVKEGAPALAPALRWHLGFLEPDPKLGPEDVRSPRIQLRDVNGDGITDLLVTLITGQRSRLDSMRTVFFHYPGPIGNRATGELVKPSARIDTQSIVLHPTFVDLDRDGDLDYVGDSIRGTRLDLIARVLGRDPQITFVGFRFDGKRGTFEAAPAFTFKRGYSSEQALSNAFGRSAWLDGDFDGDGYADLLDLGNLKSVEILRGRPTDAGKSGDPLTFSETLLGPVPVTEGLRADARVVDLTGDGRSDAVLWSDSKIYLAVPKGTK